MTYSDLKMSLDNTFELLRGVSFLVPLAPKPFASTLPLCFRVHEFYAFHHMVGHRIDYCVSLHHSIHDLIDSGVFSFPTSNTDIDLNLNMNVDSLPAYSTHVVPLLLSQYHHVSDTQGIDDHEIF